MRYCWDHQSTTRRRRKNFWAGLVEWPRGNKGEEEECESVREGDERSGSSQRSEAAHTNHRELSQQPLAHTGGTQAGQQQAGQQAVPGTRQEEQAGRPAGRQRDQAVSEHRQPESRQPVTSCHLSVSGNRQSESRQWERAGREVRLSDSRLSRRRPSKNRLSSRRWSKDRQLEHRL